MNNYDEKTYFNEYFDEDGRFETFLEVVERSVATLAKGCGMACFMYLVNSVVNPINIGMKGFDDISEIVKEKREN